MAVAAVVHVGGGGHARPWGEQDEEIQDEASRLVHILVDLIHRDRIWLRRHGGAGDTTTPATKLRRATEEGGDARATR